MAIIELGPCRPRRLQGVTVNFWNPKQIAVLMKFCQNALQMSMNLPKKIMQKNTRHGGMQRHRYVWATKKFSIPIKNAPGDTWFRSNLEKKVIFSRHGPCRALCGCRDSVLILKKNCFFQCTVDAKKGTAGDLQPNFVISFFWRKMCGLGFTA